MPTWPNRARSGRPLLGSPPGSHSPAPSPTKRRRVIGLHRRQRCAQYVPVTAKPDSAVRVAALRRDGSGSGRRPAPGGLFAEAFGEFFGLFFDFLQLLGIDFFAVLDRFLGFLSEFFAFFGEFFDLCLARAFAVFELFFDLRGGFFDLLLAR